jgi:methyltransferase FkbM-like protein
MGFAHFLNEHVLAPLGVRVTRDSAVKTLKEGKASLRRSLRGLGKTIGALRKSLDALQKDNATQRQALAKTQKQIKALGDRLAGELAQLATGLSELRQSVSDRTDTSSELQQEFLALARHFAPRAAVGQRKVRLGREKTGGYVMLDDFEDIGAAFSFGVGDDASWDLDIAGRGIPTYQFDHTIDMPPATHPNLTFIHRKIVGEPSEDGETIATLLQRYADGADKPLILKIDIEGDEWAVFGDAEPAHLRRFAQIVCEFHFFSRAGQRSWYARAKSAMEKLSRDFQVVHVHANNSMPFISVGNVPFPNILEVTFANRARYQFTDSDELFPTALDRPNWPGGADLYLGRFQF